MLRKRRRYGYVRIAPRCPVPLSPEGSIESNQNIVFEWTASPSVTHYQLYIKIGDGAFEPHAVTTSTTYVADELDLETTFNWYVNPGYLGSDGEFVAYLSCVDPLAFITPIAPRACPVLSSPADGASIDAEETTLQWVAGVDVDGYAIYVWFDGESEPAIPTFETSGTSINYAMEAGQTYRWKVDAIKNGVGSVDCGSRTFSRPAIPAMACYTEIEAFGTSPLVVRKNGGNGFTGGADITFGNNNVSGWIQNVEAEGTLAMSWFIATEPSCTPQFRWLSISGSGRGVSPGANSVVRIQFPAATASFNFTDSVFVAHACYAENAPLSFTIIFEQNGVELGQYVMQFPDPAVDGYVETYPNDFPVTSVYWHMIRARYVYLDGASSPSVFEIDRVVISNVKDGSEP